MTNQEVFTKVLTHLRQQGYASVHQTMSMCMYRSDFGDMCAVGCLIPDDLYSPSIEEMTIDQVIASNINIQVLFDGVSQELLVDLQLAHDHELPRKIANELFELDSWEYEMEQIAKKYGLIYDAPN